MIHSLARRFQLDANEARRALALGAILFALVGSYTLVKTARDADFLAQLSVSVLPYVMMVVGVLTLVAAVVSTASRRGSRPGSRSPPARSPAPSRCSSFPGCSGYRSAG